MADQLSWDSVETTEEISEKEFKNADQKWPLIGRYACTCVESKPRQADLKDYSCFKANLKWRIDKVFEIQGEGATEDQDESFNGKFLYDDVMLPHDQEKEAIKKRRIFVAKKIGLIKGNANLNARAWGSDVLGKRAVLTVDENSYVKNGKTITNNQVSFYGYESIDSVDMKEIETDNFADI